MSGRNPRHDKPSLPLNNRTYETPTRVAWDAAYTLHYAVSREFQRIPRASPDRSHAYATQRIDRESKSWVDHFGLESSTASL